MIETPDYVASDFGREELSQIVSPGRGDDIGFEIRGGFQTSLRHPD
jgi:hypothetical protein